MHPFNVYTKILRCTENMAHVRDNSPLSGMHFVIRGLIFDRIYESRFHALAFRVIRNEFLCARRKTFATLDVRLKSVFHIQRYVQRRASLNSCRCVHYTYDTADTGSTTRGV